ncbi:hypothetical protein BZA05DRAFT_413609 [Tricharina praecox]|uniref:uncharacterized protein n=1 Tax=Tricharina praecox TaxID=43433 RepID=UPI002220320E|nr:uncharacterized protein BZA05DRAFT_413609 [Tricharina praecox]KAI5840953.1 hypothetical protein BZA05DRAFT_413609 [Tricharina praecox]
MEEEELTTLQIDRYTRSLAACLAPGPLNGQFVGKVTLPTKLEAILPERVKPPHRLCPSIPVESIVQHLKDLLSDGLGAELHSGCNGDLAHIILPVHLPVAKYNEQQWRGALAGEVTEEECKAAALLFPAIPPFAPMFLGGTRFTEFTPTPISVKSADLFTATSENRLEGSFALGETETYTRESLPPKSPSTVSQASLPSFESLALKAPTSPHLPKNKPLPYRIQHTFLPSLQTLLEEACHSYINVHNQQLLTKHGWTDPQAAELHVYVREIIAIWPGGPSALPMLKALPQLRHEAVHRVPVSFARMNVFFNLALLCTDALGTDKVGKRILRLRKRFDRWHDKQSLQEDLAEMMEERMRHLELVQRKVAKEISQWEAFALQRTACPQQPERVELARLMAAVEPILFPQADDYGRDEEEKEEEEEGEEDSGYAQLHHGFPQWKFRDDTYVGECETDR